MCRRNAREVTTKTVLQPSGGLIPPFSILEVIGKPVNTKVILDISRWSHAPLQLDPLGLRLRFGDNIGYYGFLRTLGHALI